MKDQMIYDVEILKKYNKKYVVGIDEAGRGPLAGPVVCACVVFDINTYIDGVDDSKKLSSKKRNNLYDIIINNAIYYNIVEIDNNTIDSINILNATKKGMLNTLDNFNLDDCIILIDHVVIDIDNSISITKGDSISQAIASASILAKVYRDNLMKKLDLIYSEYNFKKNNGYPTKEHYKAILQYGITPYHRKSYKLYKY